MPLIVSLAAVSPLYAKTNIAFNEDDILNNRVQMDPKIFRLTNVVENVTSDNAYIEYRFKNSYEKWRAETKFLSNISKIISNKHFQAILAMGRRVSPYITNQLEQEPSNLVWALNLIYDKQISKGTISVETASRLWVKWLKQQKPFNFNA